MLRKSVKKTPALGWLKRLFSGSQQLSLPPSVLQLLTESEHLQVQKVGVCAVEVTRHPADLAASVLELSLSREYNYERLQIHIRQLSAACIPCSFHIKAEAWLLPRTLRMGR